MDLVPALLVALLDGDQDVFEDDGDEDSQMKVADSDR
jgi:hypothetical protein